MFTKNYKRILGIVTVSFVVTHVSAANQDSDDLLEIAYKAIYYRLDSYFADHIKDEYSDLFLSKTGLRAVESMINIGKIDKAILIAERISNDYDNANAWIRVALAFRKDGNNKDADEYLNRSMAIYNYQKDEKTCSRILFFLKNIGFNVTEKDTKTLLQPCDRCRAEEMTESMYSDYSIANARIGDFKKAFEIADAIKSKSVRVGWKIELSRIYAEKNKPVDAKVTFDDAWRGFQTLDEDDKYYLSYYIVRSLMQSNRENIALDVIKNMGDCRLIVYIGLIIEYADIKQPEKVAKYSKLFIDEWKNLPTNLDRILIKMFFDWQGFTQSREITLARVYILNKQIDEGVKILDKIVADIEKKDMIERIKIDNQIINIADLYSKADKYDKALRAFLLGPTGKSSINSELIPLEIKNRINSNQFDKACMVTKEIDGNELLSAAFDIGVAMKPKEKMPDSCVQMAKRIEAEWRKNYQKR